MLEKHPLRQHATEEDFELDIFVPLGLMERKQQQRRSADRHVPMEEVYKSEEKEEITRQFEHDRFLEHIGLSDKQAENTKNIAIIGEPGAGKSTLLEKLAKEIYEQNKGLPICISLANLNGICLANQDGLTIEEYLKQKWLKDALPIIHDIAPQAVTPDWQVLESQISALAQEFTKTEQGGVWLLLDGLDEMKAKSPTEALTIIEKEINSGYLAKARIVLSCRTNVWDANLTNPLSKFDIYKTLEFEDSQKDNFIQNWFEQLNKPQLGKDLIAKLKETGTERICELVKNPLRLVLLCRIWTLNQGRLPETKAEFYQRYLPYFYNWKKNIKDLTEEDDLKAKLHEALGKLAIKGIESGSRYRLKRSVAYEVMEKEIFDLAKDLGWLNIVDRDLATDEAIYAFFHPTFQEYFAARAIDDWDFFLPRNHKNTPVKEKQYRVFEPQWKEVFLLWLGFDYIINKEKESLINSLIKFREGCGSFSFDFTFDTISINRRHRNKKNIHIIKNKYYQFQAFLLATEAISEFKQYSKSEKIIKQIIKFFCEEYDFLKWETSATVLFQRNNARIIKIILDNIIHNSNKLKILNLQHLLNTIPEKEEVISALVRLLYSHMKDRDHLKLAETLDYIDPKNKQSVPILMGMINRTNCCNIFVKSAAILAKIDPSNQDLVDRLVNFIDSSSSHFFKIKATNVLISIKPTNQKAISFLVESSNVFEEKFYRQEAIANLEKMTTRDEEAISHLIGLVDLPIDEDSRIKAAESLGEVGLGNQEAIDVLIELIKSSKSEFNRIKVVDSLLKIDPGNEYAITTLNKLLNCTNDRQIQRNVAEKLLVIDPHHSQSIFTLHKLFNHCQKGFDEFLISCALAEMDPENEQAISVLSQLLISSKDESIRSDAAVSLLKINPENKQAVLFLLELLNSSRDEFIRSDVAANLSNNLVKSMMPKIIQSLKNNCSHNATKILWKCSQNLSYPDFYSAWHS